MKIKKMTDKECLETFLEMLQDRVSISTVFVQEEDTDNLTHQIMQVVCGDLVSVSVPVPLEVVLRPATGAELGATIN